MAVSFSLFTSAVGWRWLHQGECTLYAKGIYAELNVFTMGSLIQYDN